jgi:hypothetical protein
MQGGYECRCANTAVQVGGSAGAAERWGGLQLYCHAVPALGSKTKEGRVGVCVGVRGRYGLAVARLLLEPPCPVHCAPHPPLKEVAAGQRPPPLHHRHLRGQEAWPHDARERMKLLSFPPPSIPISFLSTHPSSPHPIPSPPFSPHNLFLSPWRAHRAGGGAFRVAGF